MSSVIIDGIEYSPVKTQPGTRAAAEIRRQAKEIERLRDELRQSSIDHTRAEVERLREEIAALRADAEQYRLLREESKRRSDFYAGDANWIISYPQRQDAFNQAYQESPYVRRPTDTSWADFCILWSQ